MKKSARLFLLLSIALALPAVAPGEDVDASSPFSGWTHDVKITYVSPETDRHSIHTYYLTNPESPDGKYVLFYTSADLAGHVGEIRIRDRVTRKETILAENVHTEDAHRAACQQWLASGRLVAYHEVVEGQWRVMVVDVASGEKTVVATDRQVGFGRPTGHLLPMYGCHWNPGPWRDLYLWDAETGETRTALTIADVEAEHGKWLKLEFGGKPTSIFFPVLSPDLKHVFFKMAAGNGGDDYMSKKASNRQGLVVFDLEASRMTWFHPKWGHPGWHPDSRHLSNAGSVIYDTADPTAKTYTNLGDVPRMGGSHPSVSPDGRLWVTDGFSKAAGGGEKEWGILVADIKTHEWVLLHSFDQSRGAASWRPSHPHPVFSADGQRIYYNVSNGQYTELMVAEKGNAEVGTRKPEISSR